MKNRTCTLCCLLSFVCGALTFSPQPAAGATLIPAGGIWKYLDTGMYPGSGWTQALFDDSGWLTGRAQFGYGDGDEVTLVRYGDAGNKYITTYFRHSFVVTNAASYSNLVLRVLRDDGAVIYLNGFEIGRFTMPPGPVQPTTLATTVREDAYFFFSRVAVMPAGLLVDGLNVLAAEVHQASAASSDLSFDLELADEEVSVANVVNLATNVTFAAPANLTLTTKAVSGSGVTNVKFYVNGAWHSDKAMNNTLYVSFQYGLSAPTNCQLAVAALDRSGAATTSAVQVAVEPAPDPAQRVTLVPLGSAWRYLDNGTDPGTAWRDAAFSDGAWSNGPAPLGYGKSGLATSVRANDGTGRAIVTTWFRHAWDVADPTRFGKLALRVVGDDGSRVWLNGQPVFMDNLPTGPVASTPALVPTDPANLTAAAYIDAALLVSGSNVLAAEVHQALAGPADLLFDLELSGLEAIRPPLFVSVTDTNTLLLRWAQSAAGFRLVEAAAVSGAAWTDVTNAPAPVGGEYQVTLPAPGSHRFYRLKSGL